MPLDKTNNTIEGLRGFAALLVVASHYVHHLTPNPGLWLMASTGVDLFFVLSGFVFAPHLSRPGFSVGAHLVRRFFRLYPLYVCALLMYALMRDPAERWKYFGEHLLMLHTIVEAEAMIYYNGAFWSLPPEVGFYLLLPVLAIAVSRFGLVRVFVAALLLHLALIWTAAPGEPFDNWRTRAAINLPGLLVEFMLGCLAANLASRSWVARPVVKMMLFTMASIIMAGLLIFYAAYIGNPEQVPYAPAKFRGILLLAAVSYALLVIAVVSRAPPPVPGVAESGALRSRMGAMLGHWTGRLSYGVYLFHFAAPLLIARWLPGLSGLLLVIYSLILTLTAALLFHLLVEQPMRRLGRHWASRVEVRPR